MKKLRCIILAILVTIFSMISVIVLGNITLLVNYVFKDIVHANIRVENIRLEGLSVIGENVSINTLDNEPVSKIKKVSFKLNPLAITKLKNVSLDGGHIFVTRDKNGDLNLGKIFKDEDDDSISPKIYTTSIAKIDINDVDVTFRDYGYKKPIEVKAFKAKGYMDISKTNKFYIETSAISYSGKDKLDAKVDFSYDIKKDILRVGFDNVYLDNLATLQYADIDDLTSKDVNASGYVSLDLSKKDTIPDILIKGEARKFKYNDYDKILDKVNFELKYKDDKLDINAKTKLENKDAKLNLKYDENKILDLKLDLKDVSYGQLKKYKLLKDIDLDIKAKMDLYANFVFDTKGKTTLKNLRVDLDSKNLKYENFEFSDLKASLDDNGFNIETKLETKISNDYSFKNTIKTKGDFDLLKLKGNIHTEIENEIDNEKLKKIDLDIKINSIDDIRGVIKNKYVLGDIKYIFKDDSYKLDLDIKEGENSLKVKGETYKNTLYHKYLVLAKYNDNMLESKIEGFDKKINLEAFLKLKQFYQKNFQIYDIAVNTKIEDVLSDDRKANLAVKIGEFWYNYQRLKDISFDARYDKYKVYIENIKNENIKGIALYDLKEKKFDLDLELSKYIIYTTSKYIDVNLDVNKLRIKANGTSNNFNLVSKLSKSDVTVNGERLGKLEVDVKTKDSKVYLDTKLNDKRLTKIEYNQKDGEILLDLDIKEELKKLVKVDKLNAKLNLVARLNGKLDNINGKILLNTNDIYYDKYRAPNIKLDANLSKINLLSNNKTGLIDIKEFSILGANKNKKIYSIKQKIDIDKLNINLKFNNETYDLANISKDLKGKLELGGILKVNKNDFYASINVDSKKIKIRDNELTNLIFVAQISKNGFEISKGYIEYEKNPLLVNGYMLFNPFSYNLKMIAQDFNIDFLKNASGTFNVNVNLEPEKIAGNINVKDVAIKTNDLELKRTNIDIALLNNKIKINELSSLVNGGLFKLVGNINMPNIDKDMIKNKRVKLNDINLRLTTNKVNLKYKNNNVVLNSVIDIRKDMLNGVVDIQGGNLNSLDFINSNKKTKSTGYFVTILKEMLYNTLENYEAKLDVNIVKNINMDIQNYLVVQRINGGITGSIKININKLKPYLIGKIGIVDGSYTFNANQFNVERFILSFDGTSKINPRIELLSHTKRNDEKITLSIDSKLEDLKIELNSDSNKTRESLANELTLNTSQQNVGKDLINFATTTAVNQLLNTFTSPIEKKLGLTKFEINANSLQRLDAGKLFTNINANLFIQGKIFKDLYWNFKTSIPLDISKNAIHYNLGLTYGLKGNFNTEFGMDIDTFPSGKKNVGAYLGISYKKDVIDLLDLFNKKQMKGR